MTEASAPLRQIQATRLRLPDESGRQDSHARNLHMRPIHEIAEKQCEQQRHRDRGHQEIDDHHQPGDQSGRRIDGRPQPRGRRAGGRGVASKAGVGQNRRQDDHQSGEEDERRDGSRDRLYRSPSSVKADSRRGDSDDKRGEPPRPDDARFQVRRGRSLIEAVEFHRVLSGAGQKPPRDLRS